MVRCGVITGVSGVGKSTVVGLLREGQPGFRFRDMDEGGVPAGVDVSWRRERVAAWLDAAAGVHAEGRVPVLAGVVEPEDLAEGADGPRVARFCLLDASAEVLSARLLGRLRTLAAAADLLRVTGQTPDRFAVQTLGYADHLRSAFAGRADTATIDTSDLTPQQVAEAVGVWLQEELVA